MLFSFVILHYKTIDDTIGCIESIKSIKTKHDIKIIVIDNNSSNGSFEVLEKKYDNNSKIILVHNEKNLGFAKGNNVGYKLAKEMGSDFVAVSNNDIIISDQSFVDRVIECEKKYGFDLLGSDIVSMIDNGHQNPMVPTSNDKKEIRRRIRRYQLLFLLNETPLYKVLKGRTAVSENSKNPPKKENNYVNNCQLHGSFIVYGKNYINEEKYAFCPQTFLYTEEAILYRYCMRKNYRTLYCPDVQVFHKEDSSTNSEYPKEKQKRRFLFSNLIKSHRVYLKQIKNNISEW